jgi:AcrR family transcriptional regulator
MVCAMTRLTKDNWLDHALSRLATEGHPAMTAQSLSRSLGVTRGSFYWHFESLDAFNAALIAHWMSRSTDPLTENVDRQPDAGQALFVLLRQTMQSGARLERAVRAWATVDPAVAMLVDQVDARRIGYTVAIFQRLGLIESRAAMRARLLYWAAIGRLMMPFPEQSRFSDADIADLVRLMSRPT